MPTQPNIYMDHSATTPVHRAVLDAMLPYYTEFYGNPSSIHGTGRKAHAGLAGARRTIAHLLGARENEIFFTSGGTESDNAALRGIALARRKQTGKKRIVTTPVEHKGLLETAYDLRDNFGFELTLLPVDSDGLINADDLAKTIDDDVALVSVMFANNEIGTIQPIAELAAICNTCHIPFHTDAVQAVGKLALDLVQLQVDAFSASAHKFYGPKGVGFLYLRQGTPYQPMITGGSQEGGRRAGTENIPGIVGMAKALEVAEAERTTEMSRLQSLRDHLIENILNSIEEARLTGARQQRLPNHASFVMRGVEAEGILIGLDMAGVAASSGSACTSASQKPSHVLEAIGVPAVDAAGGLRFSLGYSNTAEQVEYVLQKLPQIVAQIRGTVPIAL